ncbi:hypothetical protein LSH36_24g07049 [Paralvinella palmiformis]|uniref:Uncharacterized protein n=1 Tax=Paralvinella palmiformis TaxID=53620 RepID=A0AAD9KAZ0_9ANNE|nr:hypothetical protein LSH36_24g07049 [Paralvinella palmiformis]
MDNQKEPNQNEEESGNFLNKVYAKNIKLYDNGTEIPLRKLLEKKIRKLIEKICKEEIEEGDFLRYVKDLNMPSVLVLEEINKDDVVHYGLLTWGHSEYSFRKVQTKLEYQKVKDKIYCTTVDEKYANWQNDVTTIILSLAICIQLDSSRKEQDSFSITFHAIRFQQDSIDTCFLKQIYVENIWQYRNFKWPLNEHFNVLYGGKYVDQNQSMTRPLLELIDVICEDRVNEAQLQDYVQDPNRPAALILEECHGKDALVHFGLFSWLGSHYIFRKDGLKLEFKNIKDGDVYKVTLDEEKNNWQDNTDRMILCLLIAPHLRPKTKRTQFSIQSYTKCLKEKKDGEVKPDDYLKYFEEKLTDKPGPIVVGLHGENLVTPDLLNELETKARDAIVQVLAITDRCCGREKCQEKDENQCQKNQMFLAKCWFNEVSNLVGIMPYVLERDLKKHVNYETDIWKAELLILVEGQEDKCIIETLIKLFVNELESTPEGSSSNVECEYSDVNKRRALCLMLNGMHCVCIKGKGNAKYLKQYCRLPIPHVTVLDKDAVFVDCSADDMKDLPTDDDDELPKKHKGKELTPVTDERSAHAVKLMDRVALSNHWHYKNMFLDLKCFCKNNANGHKCEPISLVLKNCLKDELKLNMASYTEILMWYGNIFFWQYGDGTSSGALGLDKGTVLQKPNDLMPEIMTRMKKHEYIPKQINLFKEFLLKHTFRYYTNFYEDMFKTLDPNMCCERLTYRNDINVEVGHFSIHFVPSPEDPVTEDDIKNVMCNTLDTCQEKMTELYENFKGAISERTEDEAETPQGCQC